MTTCKFCGQPSRLLCDGRIWTRMDGKVFRSLLRVPGSISDRTCDAPICRQCAEKIGDVHIQRRGGCSWDTRDLCPDCSKTKTEVVELTCTPF